jgi:hypothetical protein
VKVYVAGSSAEIARAKYVIAKLRAAGIEVPGDWPAIIDAHGGKANAGLTNEERLAAAVVCLEHATTCDVFLLLVPHTNTVGAWVELGAAVEAGRRCVMSGTPADTGCSIFTAICAPVFECAPTFESFRISGYESEQHVQFAQERADDLAIAWITGCASALGCAAVEAAE